MKKDCINPKFFLFTLLAAFLFWNCSNDDMDGEEMEISNDIPDFQIIAEDETSIFLYSYDAMSEEGNTANLTLEDNVDRNYITLRQVGAVISFFSLRDGSFSLLQKNVDDQSTRAIDDFIAVSSERSIIWGAVSENQVLMANYNPPSSGQMGIRSLDISTGLFEDTVLASGVADTGNPLYYQQRLFIDYFDNTGQYNMVVMDTENLELLRFFDFGNSIPNFLIDDNGNFVLLVGDQGNFSREVYDVVTMDLIDQSTFVLEQVFLPGPIDAYIEDERFYFQYILTQPSQVPTAPAFFDFTTSENQIVDIVSIRDEVISQLEKQISLTAFGFDASSRTYLIGYGFSSINEDFAGGVIVINENGDLIDVIELPFVPTYFIKS